jgi:hypothetical protein
MELYTSKRFLNAYDRASLKLKCLYEGAIHDFVRRHSADATTVLRQYDRLAHLNSRVLEIKPSGSHRLLADYDGRRLTMLAVGKHEIVKQYSNHKRAYDIRNSTPASIKFWPGISGFFERNADMTTPFYYDEERSHEWLYFLEKQQADVDRQIRHIVWQALEMDVSAHPFFIIGGPGTGKTCILLNLLHFFCDLCETRINISSSLADYIEKSTSANISQYCVPYGDQREADLLLIDDPASKYQIDQALRLHKNGAVRNLVVAFDPLQLAKALSDEDFDLTISQYDVQEYVLNDCYRQKRNVGENTKHVIDVIARSTPFSADQRIADYTAGHQRLTSQANYLRFVNPAGYLNYYANATVNDIHHEVRRIIQHEWLMWQHTPGLLVVEGLDEGYQLSDASREALQPLAKRDYIRWVTLDEIKDIKGLEFQHVFIFVGLKLFKELQAGFSGTGRRIYDQRRLLRIPFSRAKDSLVTFAL